MPRGPSASLYKITRQQGVSTILPLEPDAEKIKAAEKAARLALRRFATNPEYAARFSNDVASVRNWSHLEQLYGKPELATSSTPDHNKSAPEPSKIERAGHKVLQLDLLMAAKLVPDRIIADPPTPEIARDFYATRIGMLGDKRDLLTASLTLDAETGFKFKEAERKGLESTLQHTQRELFKRTTNLTGAATPNPVKRPKVAGPKPQGDLF